MNADPATFPQADLEAMLLPEAEQAVELSRALEDQLQALDKSRSRALRLRKEAGIEGATAKAVEGKATVAKLSRLLLRTREAADRPENDAMDA